MKFRYNARTKEGELQTGLIDAPSRESALTILSGHDLYVLSMESLERVGGMQKFLSFFERVGRKDIMIFTRQFATLIESKIPLGDSLRTLHRQTTNPILKDVVFEISTDVDSGLALSQALDRHANIFSEFTISMVRSAEVTGRMEEVLGFLAGYLEKEALLLSKVRSALIYPAIVIALFFVVAGIMLTVVLPQITPIFKESNVPLPLLTRALIGTGDFLTQWWIALLIILSVVVLLAVEYVRAPEGKAVVDDVSLQLPVLGDLFRKLNTARFAESANVLLQGGIPVAQAIQISANTVGNSAYRVALGEIAEAVRAGAPLSQTLAQYDRYFPILVSQMVAIGEGTGRLDEMLSRVSAFYSRDVDSMVGNLVELIQPLLMIIVGVSVGVLFAAILLPLYDLARAF
ncbi:MAG: type II secretion system F family protein [Candidatus Liptonbacteria bacterium]|nr:type II secretion system F family protein [Candidatus Liptonbacteria bacterium]